MRETMDAVCAICGKSVVSDHGRVDVREGEKRFHLDCYRLYKRRARLSDPDGPDGTLFRGQRSE
jgi:hypothetical protein